VIDNTGTVEDENQEDDSSRDNTDGIDLFFRIGRYGSSVLDRNLNVIDVQEASPSYNRSSR